MSVAEAPRTWWTKTARIKEKYGNPVANNRARPGRDDYCVGGAFLRFYDLDGGFPNTSMIAKGLVKINVNLSMFLAKGYAMEIIHLNDAGNFCAAWDTLERALTY